MTDDLDDLLVPSDGPPASEALRRDLRAATSRIVRRRVWVRRAAVAGALAACYVAGVVTVRTRAAARQSSTRPTSTSTRRRTEWLAPETSSGTVPRDTVRGAARATDPDTGLSEAPAGPDLRMR